MHAAAGSKTMQCPHQRDQTDIQLCRQLHADEHGHSGVSRQQCGDETAGREVRRRKDVGPLDRAQLYRKIDQDDADDRAAARLSLRTSRNNKNGQIMHDAARCRRMDMRSMIQSR